MAQNSLEEEVICLRWVTDRPSVRSRQSPDFVLDRAVFYLRMELSQNYSPPFCIIKMGWHTENSPHCPLDYDCQLKIGNKTFYRCVSQINYLGTGEIILLQQQLNGNEILGSGDEWTVLCMFKNAGETKGYSFQVGNKRVKMPVIFNNWPPASVDKSAQVSLEVPRDIEALSSDINNLLEEEILPDFELKCGDRPFRVHRSVLAARSEVWRAMFLNQMQESQTRSCDIKDMEVLVLKSLLKFVYSGKLEDQLTEDTITKLYEAADKYAMRSLIMACSYWLVSNLAVENCIDHLITADRHSDQNLRGAAVSFILDNPEVFKSEKWSTFMREHLTLASEVLHTYATL